MVKKHEKTRNIYQPRIPQIRRIFRIDGDCGFGYVMLNKGKVTNCFKRWLRSLMPKDEKQEDPEKKATGEDGVKEKRPGVLTGQEIKALKLISPMDEDFLENCLKAASCDLRLGSDVFICGQKKPKLRKLKEGDLITIKPFDRIIFSTREKICLEKHLDIVGRLDLMIRYGLDGLILQVGTQVEPGYKGPLFGLLINTQGTQKTLRVGNRFLTIEFSRMSEKPVNLVVPDTIDNLPQFLRSQRINLDLLAEPSVIQELRNELKDYKERHKIRSEQEDRNWIKWGVIGTAIGVVIMIVLGVCNICISYKQDKTYEKLPAVINSTFDENKAGTDSNNNSQETDFDDIGKDKL